MAKIPTILESGRADGKLVTTNSIFDENKSMFQSELNDIQDTLTSDNPNKPLSAKQGKILKELLDNKVIEAGSIPIDTEPIEGNTTHIVSSAGLYNHSQASKIRNNDLILSGTTVKDNLKNAGDRIKNIENKIGVPNIVADDDRNKIIASYVKEIYLEKPIDDNKNYNITLLVASQTGFSLTIKAEGDDNATWYFDASFETWQENKIIYATIINENIDITQYKGYVVLNSFTTPYSNSGFFWSLTTNVFDILHWTYLHDYIHKDNDLKLEKLYNIEPYTKSQAVIAIKELYVQGATLEDKLYIKSGGVTVNDNEIRIAIYKNDTAVASYWKTTDGEFNKVVKFNTTDGSNTIIYAVFDEYDVKAFSGVPYAGGKLNKTAFSLKGNRMIEQYLLNDIKTNIDKIDAELHPKSIAWTNVTALNNIIKEFYIKDAVTRFPNGLFMRAVSYSSTTKKGIRFWAINNDESEAFRVEVSLHKYHYDNESDGSANIYFDSEAITPIYTYTSNAIPERIGYIKFNKDYTYSTSSNKIPVNTNIISDINNSPSIKKMLNDDRQIVLMGDSHYGYPLPSTLVDIIQGITGIKTYNLGFGGCRMAWRSEDGSNDYDVFTFPNLAKAMTTGDYSSQIAQAGLGSMPYYQQVRDLQDVDITKPFQIILHFGANDCTGGNELGNLFNPPTGFDFTDSNQRTAYLSTLDRTKYNEAFIYGLITFYSKCPTNFTIQAMNEGWRWYKDLNDDNINPYDYKNISNLGVQDYMDALKNNCHRMGIRYLDYANSGIMNAFSLRTTDKNHITGVGILGSAHLEAIGISMVAVYIANNVKNFYNY